MALRGLYNSVIACVRDICSYSDYFACPGSMKQGCLLIPLMFSFFINELAIEVPKTGKHRIQLIPGTTDFFCYVLLTMSYACKLRQWACKTNLIFYIYFF